MSLQIPIDESLSVVVTPAVIKTFVDNITINRIIDIPDEKKVRALVNGIFIELDSLSGDNYDTPNEWTNADVIEAVKDYFNVS